jgi:LysM repeat protein
MRRDYLWVLLLLFVVLGASACYKDAGENVQPTSNRVNLSDVVATTPAPSTPLLTVTATTELEDTPGGEGKATPTVRLAPTITPADMEGTPTRAATSTPPQVAPSFTPASLIETPGMSDIQASSTPAPTINPSLQPTPTGIPVEENPCIHVVQPGDTLYSIARDNEVELDALVAANASLLGGNAATTLQLGWELQLPGCTFGTPTVTATVEGEAAPPPAPPGGQTTHVVQAGETIYSIARQYGVSPDAIVQANGLANPNRIFPGQSLIIPAAQ